MVRQSTTRRAPQRDAADLFASRVLVCDGAMGTMLQAAGSPLDLALCELSLTRPELVKAIHGAYIAAGADIIETNTFGACSTRLARYGLEDRVAEINLAAVRVARDAVAASDRTVLVAGSVGPATPTNSRGRTSARRAARVLPRADRRAGRRGRRPHHLRDIRQHGRANRSDKRCPRGLAHTARSSPR